MFFDLRNALRSTPGQVAAYLNIAPETIVALESGQFEYLPPWPETMGVVMSYTALAGIDGRPVLIAIAEVLNGTGHGHHNGDYNGAVGAHADRAVTYGASQPELMTYTATAATVPAAQPPQAHRFPVEKWRQAGSAFASGAKRLPAGALRQVRQRPERAFYAVSLPLGILLLLLNTSALEAAFSHVPRPVARLAQDVRHFFQERFAPVHEGLRRIDVDDPRSRRADKLR